MSVRRPSAALQGSDLARTDTSLIPDVAKTYRESKFMLKSCRLVSVAEESQAIWQQEDNQSADQRLVLWVAYDKDDLRKLVLAVKKANGEVMGSLSLPCADFSMEARMFQSNYSFDLRRYNKANNSLACRWTFQLNVETSKSGIGRQRLAWNRLEKALTGMSLISLRYLNLPRPVDILGFPQSAARCYSLRPAVRAAVTTANQHPSAFGWDLPRSGLELRYTGTVASPAFGALWEYLGTGLEREAEEENQEAQGGVVGSVVGPVVAAGVAVGAAVPVAGAGAGADDEGDDEEEDAEARRARKAKAVARKAEGLLNTVCAHCFDGQVPIEVYHIRQKRVGKEWLGCAGGSLCRHFAGGDGSFWFHFTVECAGVTPTDVPKKKKWWCKSCRRSQLLADKQTGVEATGRRARHN